MTTPSEPFYRGINYSEFISRVDRTPGLGPRGDCHLWTGGKSGTGYGSMKHIGTHRLAYGFTFGDFPQELDVLHICDNPICCNPGHLFLGNAKDNVQDMIFKGRNYQSKRTHCPKGHSYAEFVFLNKHGHRKCSQCRREASREYKRKKRLEKKLNCGALISPE